MARLLWAGDNEWMYLTLDAMRTAQAPAAGAESTEGDTPESTREHTDSGTYVVPIMENGRPSSEQPLS